MRLMPDVIPAGPAYNLPRHKQNTGYGILHGATRLRPVNNNICMYHTSRFHIKHRVDRYSNAT